MPVPPVVPPLGGTTWTQWYGVVPMSTPQKVQVFSLGVPVKGSPAAQRRYRVKWRIVREEQDRSNELDWSSSVAGAAPASRCSSSSTEVGYASSAQTAARARWRHAADPTSTRAAPAPGANGVEITSPSDLDLSRAGPRGVRGRDGGDGGRSSACCRMTNGLATGELVDRFGYSAVRSTMRLTVMCEKPLAWAMSRKDDPARCASRIAASRLLEATSAFSVA